MDRMAESDAVARARAALSATRDDPAQVFFVQRLDLPDRAYFIVAFGGGQKRVCTVDARGDVQQVARVADPATIVPVTEERARRLAGVDARAALRLVWRPCRASRSALFPLWEVSAGHVLVYVDMFERVLPSLD